MRKLRPEDVRRVAPRRRVVYGPGETNRGVSWVLKITGWCLKPKSKKALFPGDREPAAQGAGPVHQTGAGMVAALEAMGFVRQPPMIQSGPARLGAPSERETRLTARHQLERGGPSGGPASEYIVEALIRTHPAAGGRAEFESLSLRFAVCQPEGAGWHFLKLVKQMCEALSLAVVFGERTYAPEAFWAFQLRANEQIWKQEETWQRAVRTGLGAAGDRRRGYLEPLPEETSRARGIGGGDGCRARESRGGRGERGHGGDAAAAGRQSDLRPARER